MKTITAKKVLFIKLGQRGMFERNCIENNILQLGYNGVDHNLCLGDQWFEVYDYFTKGEGHSKQTATSHKNQVKYFYTEDKETLWITFYANKLWWCFSKPEITLLDDKTKTRPVIGKWSDKDINGNVLLGACRTN